MSNILSDNIEARLRAIVLKSATNAMKKEGESAFKQGLVTYFKGKKIEYIYHIYGRVKDKSKLKEHSIHIKINLQKKELEGVECSCNEFKEYASGGYTLMCSHITATAYKFFSLLSKDKSQKYEKQKEKVSEEYKRLKSTETLKLIRKTEKDSLYYEVQIASRGKRVILKPSELRLFLVDIENRKINFKFDQIEVTAPILHKDMPLTFNLREDEERIILTTHKQLPIPLNLNHDVYYYKNELYLPSKNQVENYPSIYKKIKANKEVSYRKSIQNYTSLISFLSRISENINISEGLKNFVANILIPEFFVFEEKDKVYCDIVLNYGCRKINLLNENKCKDSFLRDYKKEEKLLMEIEKNHFIKLKNRFLFTGGDDELFNIISGRGNSIKSLGKVILGKGLKDRKIFNSAFINSDLHEADGYYDFAYSIGDMAKGEIKSAFEAYIDKHKFYKTESNNFLDFEDYNIRSFFNLLNVLNINQESEDGKIKVEKSKALYLYENINNKGLGTIKTSEELKEIENKLTNISSLNIALPDSFRGNLREYQIQGFKWLKTLSELDFGGILADEMGLGKTIQIIAFLLSGQNKRTLIVCPTSLIYNWKEELLKFAPTLNVLIIHGSKRVDKVDSISEYDVILTTYGTLRLDIDSYSDIIFDYCVIDEGQNIKNSSAQNTKVIKEVKAKTRFALTGTPIENSLTELWSIFDFIMPGYLYSKEKFEEKFISKAEENLENLKMLIKPFILRRTKKEVMRELPDKVEKKFLVEMTEPQRAVYGNYITRVRKLIKNDKNGKIEMLSYLTRLRQICLDPSLVLEDYTGGSGKVQVAMELVKEYIDSGYKILLFSQFTSVLDIIEERLNKEEINFFHLSGKTKPKDRMKMVKDFNSNEAVKVFLISLKAGGTGLNLTSANLVIHFDPWWNPAVEEQATDRAHRIGQTNIVEVIRLISKGTIEEKIILLQENKKELFDNILTGDLQSSNLLSTFTSEDLQQLFDRA